MMKGLATPRFTDNRPLPKKSLAAPAIIAALLITCVGAVGAYSWNRITAAGTSGDARSAVWQGDEATQRQAITALFDEARANIVTLKELARSGSAKQQEQANIALGHLQVLLR